MLLRLLSSLLVALAMLIAPVAMAGGAMAKPVTAAAAPADHFGHCDEAPEDERKAPVHMSCASSCAAMPAVQPQVPDLAAPAPAAPPLAPGNGLNGIAPEAETPPPRSFA